MIDVATGAVELVHVDVELFADEAIIENTLPKDNSEAGFAVGKALEEVMARLTVAEVLNELDAPTFGASADSLCPQLLNEFV